MPLPDPPSPRSESLEPAQNRWPAYLLGILFVVGLLAIVAWNVEIPYLAFSAGPVSDAADDVVAEDVTLYPPDGELLMLTIISQQVNVFEALIAAVDPTIDLVPLEAVRRPDESAEDYRNRVLQQMDDSNFRSITVALEKLGYEMVPIEVVINEFVPGVPAEGVLQLGDTVNAINGVFVTSVEQIRPLLEGLDVGDSIEMTVTRGDEILDLEVQLAERDDEPGVPMIGVLLGELTRPPFPIEIQSGDIGGPSAGMMHTLAIIDNLTEGEMTKGHVIAGTGTIQPDGSVGAIGGIRQKVVAAEAAGAEYILVPQDNYESALTAHRDHIQIVPVNNLDDAISFLDHLTAA